MFMCCLIFPRCPDEERIRVIHFTCGHSVRPDLCTQTSKEVLHIYVVFCAVNYMICTILDETTMLILALFCQICRLLKMCISWVENVSTHHLLQRSSTGGLQRFCRGVVTFLVD